MELLEVDAPYWCDQCLTILYVSRDDLYADIEDGGVVFTTFAWELKCPRCGQELKPYLGPTGEQEGAV